MEIVMSERCSGVHSNISPCLRQPAGPNDWWSVWENKTTSRFASFLSFLSPTEPGSLQHPAYCTSDTLLPHPIFKRRCSTHHCQTVGTH